MNGELEKKAATVPPDELIRDLVLVGDLGRFNERQRIEYYNRMCDSLGLNPITRPFEFMVLQGKTVLYAKKDATEQLRKKYNVSVVDIQGKIEDGLYVVTVKVQDGKGRVDMATAAIDIKGKSGTDKANIIMKCETKAKRRATLSICGLGILDESEIETTPTSTTTGILTVDVKPKGHIDRAMQAMETAKTAADIDSIKRKLSMSEWTENEALRLDDALKIAEQRIREGVPA